MSLTKVFFTTLAIVFLFTGCISVTKELPAYKTYSLDFKEPNPSITIYFDKTIFVNEPRGLNSANSSSISYVKDLQKEKYALSKWSDKPTKMIQHQIAKFLTMQNAYKYITTSNHKVKTDYNLVSELVDFKQVFKKENSFADFTLRVFLIDNKTNKVHFKNFTYTKQTKSNDAKGAVEALNNILIDFLPELNGFVQSIIKNP